MSKLLGLVISGVLAFVTGLVLFQLGMLAFVRSGAETRVPDLVGLEFAEARMSLEAAGFTGVLEREVHSSDFGEGAVLEQRPKGGEVLRKGRKVWLTVSLGLRKASVPSLVGQSYRQAGIELA
ncbi:MAG: PASTA domain-containing protein, partial [Planctomycetota bacterium]